MRLLLLWASTLFVLCSLCSAATHVVKVGTALQDSKYVPDELSIDAGDTVVWEWVFGNHSVTSGSPPSDDGIFPSSKAQTNGTWTVTFLNPGVFKYFSTNDYSMMGVVGVNAIPPQSSAPQSTPGDSIVTRCSPPEGNEVSAWMFNNSNTRVWETQFSFTSLDAQYAAIEVRLTGKPRKNLDDPQALAYSIYIGKLDSCPREKEYGSRSFTCGERVGDITHGYNTMQAKYVFQPGDFQISSSWFLALVIERGCADEDLNMEATLEYWVETSIPESPSGARFTCTTPRTSTSESNICEVNKYFYFHTQHVPSSASVITANIMGLVLSLLLVVAYSS